MNTIVALVVTAARQCTNKSFCILGSVQYRAVCKINDNDCSVGTNNNVGQVHVHIRVRYVGSMNGAKGLNEGVNLENIQRLRVSRDRTYHNGK